MRLIDADALLDNLTMGTIHLGYREVEDIEEYVKKMPTIEERKKGKWLELTNTNHTYVCSVCGRMLVNITDGKNKVTKNYPFCHCGADMRGEQDD